MKKYLLSFFLASVVSTSLVATNPGVLAWFTYQEKKRASMTRHEIQKLQAEIEQGHYILIALSSDLEKWPNSALYDKCPSQCERRMRSDLLDEVNKRQQELREKENRLTQLIRVNSIKR